ncbi:MAG: hypothetical protein HQL93_09955 [Magnetococcales bacterium]|nr:hypothetical protein [Magnetococcales bacterium]
MSQATPRIIPIQSASPMAESETPEPTLSPAEEWSKDRIALDQFSREKNWPEVLKILRRLSVKHKNAEIYKALAQRIWVGLKTEAPAIEVVESLFHLLNTLGPRHELSPAICALAHLLVKHRSPDHEDRDLAIGQSQQMFALVCDAYKVIGDEAFAIWVKALRLDDPNHYLPMIFKGLEMMVGDTWWIDKEGLQEELEQAQRAA